MQFFYMQVFGAYINSKHCVIYLILFLTLFTQHSVSKSHLCGSACYRILHGCIHPVLVCLFSQPRTPRWPPNSSWQITRQSTSSQKFLCDQGLNSWSRGCLCWPTCCQDGFIRLHSYQQCRRIPITPTVLHPHLMLSGFPILVSLKDRSWLFYITHL